MESAGVHECDKFEKDGEEKEEKSEKKRMSRNKVVMLGHMLGKNNKNVVQKHNIGHDEWFSDDWNGKILKEFHVIPLPTPPATN